MRFGVCVPNFDALANRDAIVRVARQAEEDGWCSIWITDHIIMAHDQARPYGHLVEALTTLAYLAALTERVRLGTSVIILAQRNPIIVAKQAAAIDYLSGGRMILGVGTGWNEREFGYLGANFHHRGRILDEGIRVVRTLFSQEFPTFEGRYFRFANTRFSPKPAQGASLPIWVGGNSDFAARRAARLGDGWHTTGASPDQMRTGIELIRQQGVGPSFTYSARLEVDLSGQRPPTFVGWDGMTRCRLTGSPAAIIEGIEQYRAEGVSQVTCVFPDELGAFLGSMRQFAREVAPQFGRAERET